MSLEDQRKEIEKFEIASDSSNESLYSDNELSLESYHSIEKTLNTPNSSIFGATFNFVNSIVGAGLIGLPYAIKECGFYLGTFMLIVVTLLTYVSVVSLVTCGVYTKCYDFEKLVGHLYGKIGYVVVLVSMMTLAFGAMCGYLIVIGDSFIVFNTWFNLSLSRNSYILSTAILTIFPLNLVKNMSSLSWTSFLSVMAEVIIVAVVVVSAGSTAKEQNATGRLEVGKITVFSGLGTMAFAYVCQHSSFIVFNSLKERTIASWTTVAKYSLFLTGAISLTFSVGAFWAFRDQTEPDVLKSFHNERFFIDLARVLLGLTMIFTYPMENFVFRHCTLELLKGAAHPDLVSTCCWIAVVLIALTFENLGFVFELTGSISGIALGFIFPSLCFFKTREIHSEGIFSQKLFIVGNICMLVIGSLVMVLGTIEAMADLV